MTTQLAPAHEAQSTETFPHIYMAMRWFSMKAESAYFASKWIRVKLKSDKRPRRVLATLENQAVEKTVTYTDSETGKEYCWQAIAYGEHDAHGAKLRIRRFLYLNGELYKASDFAWSSSTNALFNQCADPHDAVLMALSHAESLTGQMARGEWAKA